MRVFSEARIIVFPSFYEGFGLPVLQGLSCGKAVVARRSTLLDEIAARSRADGKLYAFSDTAELLDVVGRLLRGDEGGYLPLATALAQDQNPLRWSDIAHDMLDFMTASFEGPARQWTQRMRNIELHQGWRR
jgi:glycosyltransferase involved in cell wall biosynthesis